MFLLETYSKHTSEAIEKLGLAIEKSNSETNAAIKEIAARSNSNISWSSLAAGFAFGVAVITASWNLVGVGVDSRTSDLRTTLENISSQRTPRERRIYDQINANRDRIAEAKRKYERVNAIVTRNTKDLSIMWDDRTAEARFIRQQRLKDKP